MSSSPPRKPLPRQAPVPDDPVAAGRRQHLQVVANELRALHRSLMLEARFDYEKEHGPVASASAFLQLLMSDPFFAWLRALSSAMADLDELIDTPVPIEEAPALAVQRRFDTLVASGEDDGIDTGAFGPRYREYLQRSPDVVMAHATVRIALRKLG